MYAIHTNNILFNIYNSYKQYNYDIGQIIHQLNSYIASKIKYNN